MRKHWRRQIFLFFLRVLLASKQISSIIFLLLSLEKKLFVQRRKSFLLTQFEQRRKQFNRHENQLFIKTVSFGALIFIEIFHFERPRRFLPATFALWLDELSFNRRATLVNLLFISFSQEKEKQIDSTSAEFLFSFSNLRTRERRFNQIFLL